MWARQETVFRSVHLILARSIKTASVFFYPIELVWIWLGYKQEFILSAEFKWLNNLIIAHVNIVIITDKPAEILLLSISLSFPLFLFLPVAFFLILLLFILYKSSFQITELEWFTINRFFCYLRRTLKVFASSTFIRYSVIKQFAFLVCSFACLFPQNCILLKNFNTKTFQNFFLSDHVVCYLIIILTAVKRCHQVIAGKNYLFISEMLHLNSSLFLLCCKESFFVQFIYLFHFLIMLTALLLTVAFSLSSFQ